LLSAAKKPKKKKAKQEPEQPPPAGKGRGKKKKGSKAEGNPEVKAQDQTPPETAEEKSSSPSTMVALKAESQFNSREVVLGKTPVGNTGNSN